MDEGGSDFNISIIVRPEAPHTEEDLPFGSREDLFHSEIFRPPHPFLRIEPPGVPFPFNISESEVRFPWNLPVVKDQISPKLHQFHHGFDEDRTMLQTIPAGGAIPDLLFGHQWSI